MNSAALMTQTEFAAHRGVGKSAVSNWKKKKLVVFAEGPGGALLVDVTRTEAKLNASLDPTRGRPTNVQMSDEGAPPAALPTPAGDSLGEVRTDLLREQRVGHKIRNARDAGDLVARAEYENRAAELGRLARERMHSLVRAQAERLAAEHDPRLITAILTAEIDRTFAELADQAEAGALIAAEDDLPELADA